MVLLLSDKVLVSKLARMCVSHMNKFSRAALHPCATSSSTDTGKMLLLRLRLCRIGHRSLPRLINCRHPERSRYRSLDSWIFGDTKPQHSADKMRRVEWRWAEIVAIVSSVSRWQCDSCNRSRFGAFGTNSTIT